MFKNVSKSKKNKKTIIIFDPLDENRIIVGNNLCMRLKGIKDFPFKNELIKTINSKRISYEEKKNGIGKN